MTMGATRLDELAQTFEVFAEHDAAVASPLYERLAMVVAGDRDLLVLAAEARFQPVPNLFFAAVQLALATRPDDPLGAYYPGVGPAEALPPSDAGLPAAFKAFCGREAGAIANTLRSRRVQTNEPRRSIYLMLLLSAVARLHPERPLALVEVGAAAGLNLLFDRYAYDIGGRTLAPSAGSELTLRCDVAGEAAPVPPTMPRVTDRVGIDLHPLDVGDEADVEWLRALIWPENAERRRILEAAIGIARQEPPEVLAGDALDLLPAAVHGMPHDAWLCVFDSFSLNQVDGSARARFAAMLQDLARSRPLAWISAEMNGVVMAAPRRPAAPQYRPGTFFGVLGLIHFGPRGSLELPLGFGDGHANWVEWLNSDL